MRLVISASLLLLVAGCISMEPTQQQHGVRPSENPGSPCSDSLYIALQERSLDSMSRREYDYFRRKEMACSRWKSENSYRGKVREPTTPLARNIIVGGVVVGLAVIGYLIIDAEN